MPIEIRPGDRGLFWLPVAPTGRSVLEAHLRHLAGRFRAAGWTVERGLEPPATRGAVAVLSDPLAEPLPEVVARMAAAADGDRLAWRLPEVNAGVPPQLWRPRHGPYTLSAYRRIALRRRVRGWAVPGPGAWTGLAVASAGQAEALLARGWPPRGEDLLLLCGARVFRYDDPAAHPRPELDRFLPAPTRLLVDVGCGSGLASARHRQPGRRVVGIEPDWALARQAATRLDLVIAADAEHGLAALGATADCVLLADVLEHTSDPAAVLAAVAAALSPAGVAVVSLPNATWAPLLRALLAGRWDVTLAGPQARDHRAVMTPASFRELAGEAGLAVVDESYLPAPLGLGDRLWGSWLAATGRLSLDSLASPQWISVLRRR